MVAQYATAPARTNVGHRLPFGYAQPVLSGVAMGMKVAGVVVALLAVALPVCAQQSAPKAAPKIASKKSHTAAKADTAKTAKDTTASILDGFNAPSPAHLEAVGWRVIDDPATGARLGVPSALVPQSSLTRSGSRWTSTHGTIQIETFRLHEAALPALFDDERKVHRRVVERSTLKPDTFIMSGEQGLKRFVERVQASGSELRGITILYDQATEGMMAPVALAMADAFQGFPDPNAGPPPGLRRSVDYGTAIVVSARGHLLVAAQVVEQCQSITVAGLGHAERIAVDGSGDLALLRLYGARNLVPAAIDGQAATTDNLNLVGIADPLSQTADSGVTRAPARMTAQGLDPAPKPGFSGAAAVDPQGRFAGMVDLKWPPVVGAAIAGQAALVPADAIAAFLKSQSIAPATGRSAIDQSVLRVICVRK